MLRMNLLSFATPAFMAIGGYTVAIAGQYDITNAFLMTAAAFVLPALVAIPLGALVLRLRGTYFVLVTFVLSQIMQLLLFETPRPDRRIERHRRHPAGDAARHRDGDQPPGAAVRLRPGARRDPDHRRC